MLKRVYPDGMREEMMVTPRDVDKLIAQAAQLIACGINLALQPTLSYRDVTSL